MPAFSLWQKIAAFAFDLYPREARQAGRANPAGVAHKDIRRFRRHRPVLYGCPGPLANPAASSPGAPLGRLSFGYFDQPFGLLKSTSLPFKEK
jgi:hypothetical protein